jgi:hypothetical protein
MDPERPAVPAGAGRPRSLLLILLALAAAAFFVLRTDAPMGPPRPAAAPGTTARPGADASVDPAQLDVHLEALAAERPGTGTAARNPFRFEARTQAPPQEAFRSPAQESLPPMGGVPPASMPPSRPITVRFFGVMETRGDMFAIFVDCTAGRRTSYAREAEIVDGRYRLVKIGMESVVIEHLDGTGRTTLAQNGQECVR